MKKLVYLTCLTIILSIAKLQAYNVVVAKDGSGDVKTVQAAFDKVPDNNTTLFTIYVKKGTYKEKLRLTSAKKNVTLTGEDKSSTILTFDDYGAIAGGTDNSYSTLIEADNFTAENITFENTIDSRIEAYKTDGQAVALMVKGDKAIFHNCIIRGFQDTFYTKGLGRTYVNCCQIEGTTDFIFGAGIAVFENCTIINKKNSHTTAAANTSQNNKYNYVFINCSLKAAEGTTSTTLGRPWKLYAKVVYIKCDEGSHIAPAGWSDWSSASYSSTAYFAEYKCTGAGFKPANRLSWTHQLTDAEAAEYTIAKIFAANAASPAYSSSWVPAGAGLACTGPLGVKDYNSATIETSTFPNPASSFVEFQFATAQSSPIHISVYDINGRLVKEIKASSVSGVQNIRVQTSDLVNGLYLYRLSGENEISSGKFTVNAE